MKKLVVGKHVYVNGGFGPVEGTIVKVGVVAVPVRDLLPGGALPEEGIGDQAVNGAFLLEAVAGQSDVNPPVLQFGGMEDFAGLGVADLSEGLPPATQQIQPQSSRSQSIDTDLRRGHLS